MSEPVVPYTGVDPAIFTGQPARSPVPPTAPARPEREHVELTIDGRPVTVPQGTTILQACRGLDIDIPTLCHGETVEPEGVCRLCVVDAGGRALTPSCSAKVSQGMSVSTENERVRHSRKLVLELLGSSVDVDLAGPALPDGSIAGYMARYGADPTRFGPSAPRAGAGERDGRETGHHDVPDGSAAETVAQPVKVDNSLFVRDYARCILCYKCVEACGVDAQNTFAISVAGRGFDARVSTEYDIPLAEGACVFCGNCINVCPTGALMFRSEFEMRRAGTWDESAQTVTDTICPYCGVGCMLQLHVQDNRIVKVLSPAASVVTQGNLCVKGRFGFEFVQLRPRGPREDGPRS
ncbi:MAG: 2Fe-2S iron-sulfur cluster-binding protein [Candidatus Limnocylindrales bacterium]